MSMQQTLGAVGFVVGAYFGYPQLGFVVGSLIGGALTPAQKVEGPRIDDQKVTLSTEGAGIARCWGAVRLGGNVVESTDKIEIATTESQGKGGGGVESTTYSYYVNMRTLLCEVRPDQSAFIRKIWKDGKLIFDAGTGVSVSSAIASAENPAASLILYQGSETQLPDPTEEARYGVGNVLAYRGVVTVVMNGVECPGGRVPQFSYELAFGSTVSIEKTLMFSPADTGYAASITTPEAVWHVDRESTPTVSVKQGSASDVFLSSVISHGLGGSSRPVVVVGAPTPQALIAANYGVGGGTYNTLIKLLDLQAGTAATASDGSYGGTVTTGPGIEASSRAAYDPMLDNYFITDASALMVFRFAFGGTAVSFSCAALSGFPPIAAHSGLVFTLELTGTTLDLLVLDAITGSEVARIVAPANPEGLAYTTGTTSRSMLRISNAQASGGISFDGYVWLATDTTKARIYEITENGWLEVCSDAECLGAPKSAITGTDFYTDGRVAIVGPASNPDRSYTFINFGAVAIEPVNVAEIIASECLNAGLDVSEFDVSTIDEEIQGYTISNPSSARASIQPLMSAFAIDATDEDEGIRFFNRSDKTTLTTIAYEELGCVEDGSEPGDPMPLTRANVTELYRSVTVSYINAEFDYQTSTEMAQRQISGATSDFTTDLAITMSPDQAATAAHRILYDNHNDRNRRSMKLSRKYACYSPGDVLTVEYPLGTLADWRLAQVTDTGALIEAEVVPADAALYAQTAIGGTGYEGQAVVGLAPMSRMAIIDGPILRDTDNNAGPYVALSGSAAGYPGGELFVGPDEASLTSRGTVSNEAPMGVAENALGDWTSNIIDERNQLTVNMGRHELNSITRSQLITGSLNWIALGDNGRIEYLQFQRADSLGAGRYTLSGLRRGLRGTDRNRGTHQVGDRLVVLGIAGTLRPNSDAGSIGQSLLYRAVTKGRSLNSATSQIYANTGEGLKPLSPKNLRKVFQSTNIQLTWSRRTRFTENWINGVVPLGEGSERYEVVIYSDGTFATVKRVLTAYTNSIVYTAALQVEDFGSTQSTVNVRIFQMSDSIGRGNPLEATI